jgi:hypothetical protein
VHPTDSSLLLVARRDDAVISSQKVKSDIAFPVFFLSKSGRLRAEPFPPEKRRPKKVSSWPDLYSKLHLRWLDVSLTDPDAIQLCIDFAFLPHRFNRFSHDIERLRASDVPPEIRDLAEFHKLFLGFRPNGIHPKL